MSLAAALRASNPSQPNTLRAIRYSSRNSTAGDHVMIVWSQGNSRSPLRRMGFWHPAGLISPILRQCNRTITDALCAVFADDVRFRRGLPVGFATDAGLQQRAMETLVELTEVLRAVLSPQDMVAAAVKRAASMGAPTLRRHLTDLEELSEVGVRTPVRRRPGLRSHLTVAGDVVSLDFHNKTVRFPAHVAAAPNGCHRPFSPRTSVTRRVPRPWKQRRWGTVQRTVFSARHAGLRSGGMDTVSDDIGRYEFT
jgi:hypothetical protein